VDTVAIEEQMKLKQEQRRLEKERELEIGNRPFIILLITI
jgi:hypothetical protein